MEGVGIFERKPYTNDFFQVNAVIRQRTASWFHSPAGSLDEDIAEADVMSHGWCMPSICNSCCVCSPMVGAFRCWPCIKASGDDDRGDLFSGIEDNFKQKKRSTATINLNARIATLDGDGGSEEPVTLRVGQDETVLASLSRHLCHETCIATVTMGDIELDLMATWVMEGVSLSRITT